MKRIFPMLIVLALALTACASLPQSSEPLRVVDGTESSGKTSFEGEELVIYNYFDYIDPEIVDIFEAETGARVQQIYFASPEEMYTKLESGTALYDVAFSTEYMVERLIREGRLEKLNLGNIPNISGVSQWLLMADCDPRGEYSVPYMWGTVGILYNKKLVNGPVTGWDAIFGPDYTGDLFMMSSMRDTIGIALKALGHSINSRDPEHLDEARQLLVDQKRSGWLRGYFLDEAKDKMIGEEASMALMYSGDAIYSMEANENLRYIIPEGGSNIWMDRVCIPAGSRHKECAEAFINFLCREDIAARNMEYIYYSSPIQSVLDGFDAGDFRMIEAINPPQEHLEKCEFFHDVSDSMELFESVWMEVRLA
ncbi:MAG: spermidine/putrescine ABC transporter substrate-binding protein, partial [Christensenellales bacterium]|nr:spermidine/putrescine ABC transporter substrate-binding protein [Christensenellales bacterium]